ncbi:MAG: TonB-dependent receptor [Gammaproteobacteria bacterium]
MKNLFKILVLLSALVHAQAATDSDDIEEVVVKGYVLYSDQVNALKTPVPVLDVPQTVSIVTDEDIRKQGFRSIGDIVRYTPGVNTSQGEGHRDSVVFRGVRSTADFYQDGVRDDVQYYRSLYNLDQVEILRGPNALLFGRGGTGGMINRVTKKAVIGETFTAHDIGIDSFGASDLGLDTNVQLDNNSALRINLHSDDLANHRDHYDGSRLGINPTMKIALNANTTLDLSYEYADHERFIDRGIPTINGKPDESLADVVFGDSSTNIQTLEANIMRAQLTQKMSETKKLNFSMTSSSFEKMYQNLYASGYDGTFVTMDGYRDPTERDNFIVSGNLVNELSLGNMIHTLLIGAEFIDTENKNLRYDAFWSSTSDDNEVFNITRPMDFSVSSAGVATGVDFATALNRQTESDITVSSFYIQDQIDVSDNLKVLLGGRIDDFDITVRDIKNGSSESKNDNTFSPRAGLVYKPQENVSYYISYSESFLPRSGEQFKSLSATSARLDPDVFESTEFGVKLALANNMSFTAAYFDSEQVRAERDNDTGETSEVRGLTVSGIELELKGRVNDSLNLAVGYSDLSGETSSGGIPREIPEHTLSAYVTYQMNDQLSWALGLTQQGESKIKDNTPGLVLPEYTRVDLAAYYVVAKNLTVQMNVENLMDELYFPHSHSTHQATVGESLNTRVSMRWTY